MTFDELLAFIEHDMRMSHVYQPVMIRTTAPQVCQCGMRDIA
jgi:hypothetical protein